MIKWFNNPVARCPPAILEDVDESDLRAWVEKLAVPRHYESQPEANEATAAWLQTQFAAFGWPMERHGSYRNLLARGGEGAPPRILVGAHYDSVARTPGADDNASGLAAMLACARALADHRADLPLWLVAFNREEDGGLGSKEFVAGLPKATFAGLRAAVVLEMVGYADRQGGSQTGVRWLPLRLPKVGDFLAVAGNPAVRGCMRRLKSHGQTVPGAPPLKCLVVRSPLTRLFPGLLRSDHEAFWKRGLPAMMWTDTAEYRNPHYHREGDLPDSLDYGFLAGVTRLLLNMIWTEAAGRGVPGRGVPGRGVPGRGVPGRGVPGRGVPGRGAPG